jgi:hypothetical protein
MKVGSLVRTTSSPTKYLVVKVDNEWAKNNNDVVMVTAINVQTGAYQSLPSQCYEVISEYR